METTVTGKRIKELRKKHKLTQSQLGEIIGVQKSAVAKYERGEIVNLKRETISKLSNYFNVKPSFLMGIDDENTDMRFFQPKDSEAFCTHVGNRLKLLRKRNGYSQEELAKLLNVDLTTIKNLENGVNHGFDTSLLRKCCEVLDVDSAYFFDMLEPVVNIGDNIKMLREANLLSLEDGAEVIGLTSAQLSEYEEGMKQIPYDVIEKISTYYNCEINMLVGLDFKAHSNEPDFKSRIRLLRINKIWVEEVGDVSYSEEELEELMNYAKYILSKRNNNK